MELSTEQLKQLFEGVIRPEAHPDPLGLMARILLTSEGNPDYVDLEGRVGLLPVHPDRAMEVVGSIDAQTIEGNIASVMAMDILFFDQYGSIQRMIEETHGGPNEETRAIWDAYEEMKREVSDLLYPRLATVDDVINILKQSDAETPSKKRMTFFKELLSDGG